MNSELIQFMKESQFPAMGCNVVFPTDILMSEQCFGERGIFKNEDLVIEAFAYQIREVLNTYKENENFKHDDILFKSSTLLSGAGEFIPSEIIIKGPETGNILRIKGAALESFIQTYLDGLGNEITLPINLNKNTSIQQVSCNIFYWLKNLLVENTTTEFPANILRVIAKFIVATKLSDNCDEDKARQYIKRGIDLRSKISSFAELHLQRYYSENQADKK